jgi:hypothetical protein
MAVAALWAAEAPWIPPMIDVNTLGIDLSHKLDAMLDLAGNQPAGENN